MDLALQGKTAIVTGGSGGIGRGLLLEFAREGLNVVSASRDVSTSTVTVRHSGQTVSIFAAGGSGNGTKHGCSINGYSFEWEDEGVTRGNGSAKIASGGNLIEGSGSWTWSGDGYYCSGPSKMTFRR